MNLNKGGSSIPRVEDGTYPARLVSLIDLGVQKRDPYQGQEKKPCNQVIFTFELPTEKVEIEGEEKPRILGKTYNVFNSSNAVLPKVIKALDPTDELSNGGENAGNLVGQACMVEIGSTESGKAKITNVSQVMKGFTVPEANLDLLVFDYDEPSLEVYNALPQWIQERLRESLDFDGSGLQKLLSEAQTEPSEVAEDSPY